MISSTVPLILYNTGFLPSISSLQSFPTKSMNYSKWRAEFCKSAFDKSTSYSPCCSTTPPLPQEIAAIKILSVSALFIVFPAFSFSISEHRNMLCHFSCHICQRLHRDTPSHNHYSYITWQSRQESSKEEWSWTCNNSNNQQGLNISVVSLTVNFTNCSLTVTSFLWT